MGIGVSIFLMAVGAILTWGVTAADPSGFDINTIGVILMVVGALGFLAALVFWGDFSYYGRHDRRGDTVVVRDREIV